MTTKRLTKPSEQPDSESEKLLEQPDTETQSDSTEPSGQTELSDANAVLKPETSYEADDTLPVDSTLLQRLGLPYCEKCGYQNQSGLLGEPICAVPHAVSDKDCPRLK